VLISTISLLIAAQNCTNGFGSTLPVFCDGGQFCSITTGNDYGHCTDISSTACPTDGKNGGLNETDQCYTPVPSFPLSGPLRGYRCLSDESDGALLCTAYEL